MDAATDCGAGTFGRYHGLENTEIRIDWPEIGILNLLCYSVVISKLHAKRLALKTTLLKMLGFTFIASVINYTVSQQVTRKLYLALLYRAVMHQVLSKSVQ
jgi:hypothetical protein